MVSGCSGWIRMVSGWCLKFELKIFVNFFFCIRMVRMVCMVYFYIIEDKEKIIRMVRMVRVTGWFLYFSLK